jgi:magnesium and cobalt exporter, CNNM family
MNFKILVSFAFVIILLIISAILATSEGAYLSASRAKLHAYVKEGRKIATLALKIRNNMEKVISTLILSQTLFTVLATIIFTQAFVLLIGERGFDIAPWVITPLIVIFSELMPKFYAIRKAEFIAMRLAPVLDILIKIVRPAANLMEWLARYILRLFGINIQADEAMAGTLEELRGAIDLHRGMGEEAAESRAMLHSVLDLSDVSIEEIMIHRKDVKMINLDDDISTIMQQVIGSHHTRLPIWQGSPDQVLGILHTKDFLRLIQAKEERELDHQELIKSAKKPWFIPETATLFEQLQAFRRRREHMALVVDEYGTLRGIVTLEDIIEEIVGSIEDEHDIQVAGIWQAKSGEIYSTGSTTIRDLNRRFDWDLPDEEASTIAGLIMHEAWVIPSMGQVFNIRDYRIKVLRRVRNQISLVKIVPPFVKKAQDGN